MIGFEGRAIEFLPGESAIAVQTLLMLVVAIPATMLAASLSNLPERSLRRAGKAGLFIFLTWLLFTAASFKATNSTVSLLFVVAGFFVTAGIFERVYKITFKRGFVATVLFIVSTVLFKFLAALVLGAVLSFRFLAFFSAELKKNAASSHVNLSSGYGKVRLQTVETEVVKYYNAHGSLPGTLDDVSESCVTMDFFGRPILYKVTGAATAELSSLGQDGKPGGSGANEDVTLFMTQPTPSPK